VETKKHVNSYSNVILTRQTCGQRLGMAAASKRRALAFYFSVQICYMFLISKYRGESDLGLCKILGLAKRMPLRSADFRRILRPNTFENQKLAHVYKSEVGTAQRHSLCPSQSHAQT